MTKFKNTSINLISDWNTIWKAKDTVLKDFVKVPIKLIVWYDSLLCVSCQITKMDEWNEITMYADSFAEWFSIIYLFTPQRKDLFILDAILKDTEFNYPLFIDINGTFVRQNPNLPKQQQLHTFLLDKNNRVILVGNPLHNPPLWELYKSTIQKLIVHDGVLPAQ